MRNRRITKACFRTCSTCPSRSQAPLCLYAQRAIANRAEGTFARLRYSLGGDRPSQTTRLTLFPGRLYGPRLESRHRKGGISPVTPRDLTIPLHSLPPILHRRCPNPISGYSKGARGLFVLLRVIGILTDTPISPSSWSRQCPSRYAIRAGRNLPDKEFRSGCSTRRRAAWTISSSRRQRREMAGVWPLGIPLPSEWPFLLIVRTGCIVTGSR